MIFFLKTKTEKKRKEQRLLDDNNQRTGEVECTYKPITVKQKADARIAYLVHAYGLLLEVSNDGMDDPTKDKFRMRKKEIKAPIIIFTFSKHALALYFQKPLLFFPHIHIYTHSLSNLFSFIFKSTFMHSLLCCQLTPDYRSSHLHVRHQ